MKETKALTSAVPLFLLLTAAAQMPRGNGRTRAVLLLCSDACSEGIFTLRAPLPYTGRQLSLRADGGYLSSSTHFHILRSFYPHSLPLSRLKMLAKAAKIGYTIGENHAKATNTGDIL